MKLLTLCCLKRCRLLVGVDVPLLVLVGRIFTILTLNQAEVEMTTGSILDYVYLGWVGGIY